MKNFIIVNNYDKLYAIATNKITKFTGEQNTKLYNDEHHSRV